MYNFYTKKPGIPEGYIHKIWLIMRLTTVIIIASLIQVSASTFAQKISINQKRISLAQVFKQVRIQSGYDVLYDTDLLKDKAPINLNIKDASIEEAMTTALKSSELSFEVKEKTIVILKKEPSFLENVIARFQSIDVRGRVVDEQGNGLPGARVAVKDGKGLTISDGKGGFYLQNVENNAVLIISYIGYVTKEIHANSNVSVVILEQSNSKLDEVQVLAYGQTSRRLSTANTGTVKSVDIEKQPVTNPLLAMQGRVPGLFIQQSNGLSGGGVSIRIQGQNSIGKGNDPLYVIDGVPYTPQMLPTVSGGPLGASGGTNLGDGFPNGGSSLSFINPSDIESIDVLKDADATAIYGSRAANGAVLITTKKGKVGETRVNLNMYSGWGKVSHKLDLLNTQQYLEMRSEAFKNDNRVPSSDPNDPGYAPDLTIFDNSRYTDWQKQLIGGTAKSTHVDANVSGGSPNTQYLIGSTYHRESSVFPGNSEDKKTSVHFSINNKSPNNKFQIQLTGNYLVDDNQLPSNDFTSTALLLAPNAPSVFNADGSLNWMPNSNGSSTWVNPYRELDRKYSNKTSNLIANSVVSYRITKELTFATNLGYTNLQTDEFFATPLSTFKPELRPTSVRTATYTNSSIKSWIIEPKITFKKGLGGGIFDAILGSTITQNNNNGLSMAGSGYNSDEVLGNIKSATSIGFNTLAAIYKYRAIFGRINYNWGDKYIINVTARRDGSSRFGSNNQFHTFGAIGGAWIFSEEDFIKDKIVFISFGKLRASYGTSGNDQIGDYQYLNLYAPNSPGVLYQGAIGLGTDRLPNPYLQWEETRKLQFGIELGFLKDRILLSANHYQNRSSNQILPYVLPVITGFFSITDNFPATVQNSGWEVSLSTKNIQSQNLNWSTTFNFTKDKNEVLSFPNLDQSAYANYLVIGQPISIIKAFNFVGVDPSTGQYQFKDNQGNITFEPNPQTDKTVLINTLPKFYGGIQNSVTYKGFGLDFFFQFVKKISPNFAFGNPDALMPGFYNNPTATGNQPASVLNRWQKVGDNLPVQKYNTDFSLFSAWSNALGSNAGYSDASYIRLKNLSVSWNLPKDIVQKARLQNVKVFIRCQNLLTITKYKGLDPENTSTSALPPLKVITAGLQVGL